MPEHVRHLGQLGEASPVGQTKCNKNLIVKFSYDSGYICISFLWAVVSGCLFWRLAAQIFGLNSA